MATVVRIVLSVLFIIQHASAHTANATKVSSTTLIPPGKNSFESKVTKNEEKVPSSANPSPPPKFPQNIGDWSIKENGVVCIEIIGAIQIIYNHSIAGANQTEITTLDVPTASKESGNCGNATQMLSLAWESQNQTNCTIRFQFEIKDKKISLTQGKVSISTGNTTQNFNIGKVNDFDTPMTYSFQCKTTLTVPMDNNATLKFANLKMQAFRPDNSVAFEKQITCSEDNVGTGLGVTAKVFLGIFIVILIVTLAGGIFWYFRRFQNPTAAYNNM
ncbi:macrosialin [Folsomia candida]|uniref:Lysosome-associated membrane glycoprotein 5 n=1 Tax=Folsomia candida TaxID=158441 RepID=A0A226F1V5_FOLCA|nr:macrosialin [Folsomia candida]OXA63763.1 Lysosome-associated membrane glycoprotein 5 [Folsomia candida]